MRITLFSRLMVFLPYRQCEATLSGAHEEIDKLANKLQHVDTTTTCRYIQTDLPIELLESLNHEIKILASQNVSLASHNEALASKLEDLSHQFAKDKQEFSEQSQKFAVSTAAQIQRLEKEVEIAFDLSQLDVLREHEEKNVTLASHNEALASKLEDLSHQFAKDKQEFSEQSQKFSVSTAVQIQRLEKEVESIAFDLSRLDVLREHEEKIAGLKDELQRVNMMNTSEKKMWRSILDERTNQFQKSFTTYENDKESLTKEVITIQGLVIIGLPVWIYTPWLSCVMGWLTL